MTASQIEQFLVLIGAENITRDSARGWIRSSCPLAPWLHENGVDNKPSFGIKINNDEEGQAPYFHCFSCGTSGPLPRLLANLAHFRKNRMLEASNFLSRFQLFEEPEDTVRKKRRIRVQDKYTSERLSEREIKNNLPVPAAVLDAYPLLAEKNDLTAHADALRWLVYDRNITLHSIAKFQLRLYVEPILGDVGVIFPIIDKDGTTVLDLWLRLITRKKFFRLTKDFTGSSVDYKAPNLWFGNHIFQMDKPGILVEGALDACRLVSLRIGNVAASLGAPSNEQLDSIYAPSLILGFDNDEAGRAMTKKAVGKLQVPAISILDWGVVGIKDAGELESEAQLRIVFDARTKILQSQKAKIKRLVKSDSNTPTALRSKDDPSFL